MPKTFNTTGICFPHQHYMVDVSGKLREVLQLIENEKYFTINRPRQYGKTTLLYLLEKTLRVKEDYTVIALNFQGIDNKWYQSDAAFAQMFFQELTDELVSEEQNLAAFIEQAAPVTDMRTLSVFITKLVEHLNHNIILLIDEVDASSSFEPFLKFLGMLRTKYLKRHKPNHRTFQSVVLAGVHDIKTLKFKIQNAGENEYNSPWNIAVDFNVKMSFSVAEIASMLTEYSQAEQVDLDTSLVAERLHYYTAGYPFLVSKICETVVQFILPTLPSKRQKTWLLTDIDAAVRILLKKNNTNFDSLIANLERNEDLYNLVQKLLITGDNIPFNQHNPTIHRGVQYGIFSQKNHLQIHNRIYEQIIYNYLTSKATTQMDSSHNYNDHFIVNDSELDMVAVLQRFQIFMQEQYSQRNDTFLEEHGRLIFLAFFAPILNGKGYAFREVQTSMEKRLDIVVTYLQHKYVVELKRWYGQKAHIQGLDQLADYLTIQGLVEGYLLIYDFRKDKTWREEWIDWKGKRIYAVWI